MTNEPPNPDHVEALSTADLWELRRGLSVVADPEEHPELLAMIQAEIIERLNGKPDPTAQPEPVRDLAVVTLPDGTVLTENPMTGEALDLLVMDVDALFKLGDDLDEHLTRVYALKQAAVDVIAHRVDSMGSGRTAVIDGHTIKVNAPTTTPFNVAVVEENLRLLVEAEVLPPQVLDNIIVTPEQPPQPPRPPAPPPYVDKAKAKMLKDHPDQRVRAAIEQAGKPIRQPRKITEHKPPVDGVVQGA